MIPNSVLPFTRGLVSRSLQRAGVHDPTLLRLRVAAILILPLLAWLPLLLLSAIADLLIIAVIYLVDTLVARRTSVSNDVATCYAASVAQGSHLTPAGHLLCISKPAHLSVRLTALVLPPLHLESPLRARLSAESQPRLGAPRSRRRSRLSDLTESKGEIVAIVVFVLCLTIAPLTVFARSLIRAKRRGVIEYGALAARYANEFHDKWIVPETDGKEPLVGSADIQSLADIAGSYEIVQTMRSVPITAQMILAFAGATLLPVGPLMLISCRSPRS